MFGNFDARRKSQGIIKKKKQEKPGKFIFSQSGHPNFENFLRKHTPRTVLNTQKFNQSRKSRNFMPSGKWTPCVLLINMQT